MTDRTPLLSVGIAAYNCELYLAEAIESVLAEPGMQPDIVVVVDGGEDRSHEIALSFADRGVRTFLHERNLGIGAARNTAIDNMRGDFLMFLDGDDRRPAGGQTAATMLAALDAEPGLDMAFGMAEQFLCPLIPQSQRDSLACPTGPMPAVVAGGMIARRSLFERVGKVDANLRVGEFLDWLLRAKDMGHDYKVIDRTVLERRIHGANTSLLRKSEHRDYALALKHSLDRRRARTTN